MTTSTALGILRPKLSNLSAVTWKHVRRALMRLGMTEVRKGDYVHMHAGGKHVPAGTRVVNGGALASKVVADTAEAVARVLDLDPLLFYALIEEESGVFWRDPQNPLTHALREHIKGGAFDLHTPDGREACMSTFYRPSEVVTTCEGMVPDEPALTMTDVLDMAGITGHDRTRASWHVTAKLLVKKRTFVRDLEDEGAMVTLPHLQACNRRFTEDGARRMAEYLRAQYAKEEPIMRIVSDELTVPEAEERMRLPEFDAAVAGVAASIEAQREDFALPVGFVRGTAGASMEPGEAIIRLCEHHHVTPTWCGTHLDVARCLVDLANAL